MIKLFTWLALIIILLGLPAPVLAAEPGGSVIKGQVINGTADGSSVANQEVILKTYLNDTEVDATTTITDAEGAFVFTGLSTEPGYGFQAIITYQQAEYLSDWLTFADGEPSKSIVLTVYDATTSDASIRVMMAHTIVYVELDSLRVEEYFLVVNESDRTYIGAEEKADGTRETLWFPLPDEVTELQPGLGLMECCIYGVEGGFVDVMPVLPGGKELVYSYRVGHHSGEYTFSREVNYPTVNYDFLIQGEDFKLTSDRLVTEEPLFIQDVWFSRLSGTELAPRDILAVRLSNLPQANNQTAVLWVSLVLGGLIGGFSFGYYLLRKRRLQPVTSEASLNQKKQRLLIELSQLDDDFEGGKLDDESYHRLRAEKKLALLALMQREKSGRG